MAKIPACMTSMAMHSIHATARSVAVMDFTELCRQCTVYAKVIAGASRWVAEEVTLKTASASAVEKTEGRGVIIGKWGREDFEEGTAASLQRPACGRAAAGTTRLAPRDADEVRSCSELHTGPRREYWEMGLGDFGRGDGCIVAETSVWTSCSRAHPAHALGCIHQRKHVVSSARVDGNHGVRRRRDGARHRRRAPTLLRRFATRHSRTAEPPPSPVSSSGVARRAHRLPTETASPPRRPRKPSMTVDGWRVEEFSTAMARWAQIPTSTEGMRIEETPLSRSSRPS